MRILTKQKPWYVQPQVVVTDVVDASEFFVQKLDEPRVAWLAQQLAAAGEAPPPAIPVREWLRGPAPASSPNACAPPCTC